MRKSSSVLKNTGAVLLAVLLCTVLQTGCDTRNTNHMAQRAAELLAAGQPAIYNSSTPFALGELIGKPSEAEPWWTLKYGGFPVISSGMIPAGLAESFAEAHIGYPNRDKGSTHFVTSNEGRDYIMEQFLERNEYGGGDYYDYERGIRFESVPANLLLLTEVSQEDKDYLESKGGKVVAIEVARTALVFMVPSDFPADNLTLEQLKGVLSGGITDWTSLGSELPVSLHYTLNDDYVHMLEARVLRGATMSGAASATQKAGTLTGTVTIQINVPYDNRPGVIGIFPYDDVPDVDGAKILTIDGATPTDDAIRSGEYPVIVGCYAVYWETDNDNAPGHFVQWCASEEGTAAIRTSGLIPVYSGETGNGGVEDGDDLADWNGFDFGQNLEYIEEYEIIGDPGDHLPAWEAAKLTFDTMRDNGNIPDYSDGEAYTIILVDMTDIEGEECYVFSLNWGSDTVGAAYAYARQSGNIYMEGQMGIWVIPE